MSEHLNQGVYKAGFAPNQETYDKNVIPVFAALNKLEKIISANGGPYVLGGHLTELDIKLYATAIRFDTVYVQVSMQRTCRVYLTDVATALQM